MSQGQTEKQAASNRVDLNRTVTRMVTFDKRRGMNAGHPGDLAPLNEVRIHTLSAYALVQGASSDRELEVLRMYNVAWMKGGVLPPPADSSSRAGEDWNATEAVIDLNTGGTMYDPDWEPTPDGKNAYLNAAGNPSAMAAMARMQEVVDSTSEHEVNEIPVVEPLKVWAEIRSSWLSKMFLNPDAVFDAAHTAAAAGATIPTLDAAWAEHLKASYRAWSNFHQSLMEKDDSAEEIEAAARVMAMGLLRVEGSRTLVPAELLASTFGTQGFFVELAAPKIFRLDLTPSAYDRVLTDGFSEKRLEHGLISHYPGVLRLQTWSTNGGISSRRTIRSLRENAAAKAAAEPRRVFERKFGDPVAVGA